MMECKFCGKEIGTAKYLSQKDGSCSDCTSFCMKKCPNASTTTMSWHKEPCISCGNNPYQGKHIWNGREWIASDRH